MNQKVNYTSNCPIWGTPAKGLSTSGNFRVFDSPRAGGKFKITRSAEAKLQQLNNEKKALLTSWIFGQNFINNINITPIINSELLERVLKGEIRSISNYEKIIRMVKFIEQIENSPSEDIYISHNNNYKLFLGILSSIESKCSGKLKRHQQHPIETPDVLCYSDIRGVIRLGKDLNIFEGEGDLKIRLTAKAYEEIEKNIQIRAESNICFVAMWFNDSVNEVYERAIKPAIQDAGYEALRIDEKEHNNKIDDEIILAIKKCKFVIADFTQGNDGPRGGVYYEAGYAHGLGKQVIFTCREDMIDEVHFDTRQYNHILWNEKELDEFKKRLKNRILNTIGKGPNK